MKTNQFSIQQFRKLCVGTSLLVTTCFPSWIGAQTGSNDASFNGVDKIASQGSNNPIDVSVIQPDNKIIIAGDFTRYNGGVANKIARLKSNGKLDNSFNSGLGPNGPVNSIVVQPDKKILIGGSFYSYNGDFINNFGRLNSNGSLDQGFYTGVGANNMVSTVLLQPDGKILLAGTFTSYNDSSVSGLVRLNSNGRVDPTFKAIITDSLRSIDQIALQPDGKIIIGAREKTTMFYSEAVIRLNNNGSRDYAFKYCSFDFGDIKPTIKSIAVENDGNILLAGTVMDNSSSVPYHGMFLRISSAGDIITRKGIFWINDMKLQSDGKIIVAGLEDFDWASVRRKIIRMNQDLTIDSTFIYTDKKVYEYSAGASIETIGLQSGGKIIMAGNFFESNELLVNNIACLNSNGSINNTFNERTGCNGTIRAVAEQPNGKLIIGGEFSKFNYSLKSNLVRLSKNGTVDRGFYTGAGTNGPIYAIAIQTDGKIIIGGDFTSYNGISCQHIARLNSNGTFDPSFGTVTTDAIVRKIVITKDDKIIIGGSFKEVNGTSKNALARLLINGMIDSSFNPVIGNDTGVYDCKISNTGMIYIAVNAENGPFGIYGATLFCLDKSGALDPSFHAPADKFEELHTIAFTNDGKILAGGWGHFTPSYITGGIVTKLNLDGSLDSTFNYEPLADFLRGNVRTINVLKNNRILIGGDFVYGGGALMNHIGLLNSDGTVNFDFTGTADRSIYATALLNNDKMIIAGAFGEYNGTVRNSIARINVEEETVLYRAQQPLNLSETPEAALHVYPNPASSDLTIDNLEIGSTIRILNAMGQVVQAIAVTNQQSTIELTDYSNGIYFVMEENNGKRRTVKLVVNK